MVQTQKHINKIEEIKQHINNSKGQQRKQYIKCLHRLEKELNLCNYYLKGSDING